MNWQILEPGQQSRVASLFREHFKEEPPLDHEGVILYREDEHGEIVSIATLEYLLHLHCLWSAPAYRGLDCVRSLAEKAKELGVEEEVRGVFTCASDERLARLWGMFGFRELPKLRVFRWLAKGV